MSGSRLLSWMVCSTALAFAAAGCSTDTQPGEVGGALSLELTIAEGVEIDEVAWRISHRDMTDMTGTIDTSAPGSTASVEVFGLLPGGGYVVYLTATSTDEEVTCGGSTPFSVEVGQVTDVEVMLNCKLPKFCNRIDAGLIKS
jgi:hypothetical protein